MRICELGEFLAQVLPDIEVVGNEQLEIKNVAKIEHAREGDISFISNSKYEKFLSQTNASAVILSKKLRYTPPSSTQAYLIVDDAYTAFVYVMEKFIPKHIGVQKGVHPTSTVYSAASDSCSIGANVFVGKNCKIGEHVVIYPNVVVLDDVSIGDDVMIYPNVTLYRGTVVGNRVVIHAGAVVGSDGFGFAQQKDKSYKKIPQVGIVVIGDDVEIGANTCIDRATLGETRIESGVKLDNLVQIAHNVVVGKNTVIASQAGISGSSKLGESCVIAGQVGLVGHIELANQITVGAQSGVAKSIMKEGEFVRGYPARPLRQQLRQEAYQAKLGELFEQVKKLEEQLAQFNKINQ